MICEEISPLRISRSCSSSPRCDTPIRLPSTTRFSFSRVLGSWAAVSRIARSVGVGNVGGAGGDDDDVSVEHVVVVAMQTQGERGRAFGQVRIDSGAGYLRDVLCGPRVDELKQGAFHVGAAHRHDLAATLPGHHDHEVYGAVPA